MKFMASFDALHAFGSLSEAIGYAGTTVSRAAIEMSRSTETNLSSNLFKVYQNIRAIKGVRY